MEYTVKKLNSESGLTGGAYVPFDSEIRLQPLPYEAKENLARYIKERAASTGSVETIYVVVNEDNEIVTYAEDLFLALAIFDC